MPRLSTDFQNIQNFIGGKYERFCNIYINYSQNLKEKIKLFAINTLTNQISRREIISTFIEIVIANFHFISFIIKS